mgnify:CR=1 FL=1
MWHEVSISISKRIIDNSFHSPKTSIPIHRTASKITWRTFHTFVDPMLLKISIDSFLVCRHVNPRSFLGKGGRDWRECGVGGSILKRCRQSIVIVMCREFCCLCMSKLMLRLCIGDCAWFVVRKITDFGWWYLLSQSPFERSNRSSTD